MFQATQSGSHAEWQHQRCSFFSEQQQLRQLLAAADSSHIVRIVCQTTQLGVGWAHSIRAARPHDLCTDDELFTDFLQMHACSDGDSNLGSEAFQLIWRSHRWLSKRRLRAPCVGACRHCV